MFQQRPRLGYDGIYFILTCKLLQGMEEGRGMKEASKDFYNPRGRWSSYYRIFKFFPDGCMFHYLTSTQPLAQPSKPLRELVFEAVYGELHALLQDLAVLG